MSAFDDWQCPADGRLLIIQAVYRPIKRRRSPGHGLRRPQCPHSVRPELSFPDRAGVGVIVLALIVVGEHLDDAAIANAAVLAFVDHALQFAA